MDDMVRNDSWMLVGIMGIILLLPFAKGSQCLLEIQLLSNMPTVNNSIE